MKKGLCVLLLLALSVGFAVAGGGQEKKAGGTTINFLCVNENYTQAMKDCIARWEAKTGNKVAVQLYPAAEYITIL